VTAGALEAEDVAALFNVNIQKEKFKYENQNEGQVSSAPSDNATVSG
jgi:hypothetical protein